MKTNKTMKRSRQNVDDIDPEFMEITFRMFSDFEKNHQIHNEWMEEQHRKEINKIKAELDKVLEA